MNVKKTYLSRIFRCYNTFARCGRMAISRYCYTYTRRLYYQSGFRFGQYLMTQLRLRIELNKGGLGISMDKLAEITTETERFLRMIVEDVSRQATGRWIAKDFDNNSVDFTAAYISETITSEQIQECRQALAYTMNEQTDLTNFTTKIRRATLLQYSKIAKPIAPDEAVHFGLFDIDTEELTEHHVLSKERSLEIEQRLQLTDRIQYDGSAQGIITALFKGNNPHFRLKELYTEDWFPCYFSYNLYEVCA
jgi:hypothetical protein